MPRAAGDDIRDWFPYGLLDNGQRGRAGHERGGGERPGQPPPRMPAVPVAAVAGSLDQLRLGGGKRPSLHPGGPGLGLGELGGTFQGTFTPPRAGTRQDGSAGHPEDRPADSEVTRGRGNDHCHDGGGGEGGEVGPEPIRGLGLAICHVHLAYGGGCLLSRRRWRRVSACARTRRTGT